MTDSPMSIRVLVVDDSALMRHALSQVINAGRGFEVVGVARDGREALDAVRTLRPHVVTMDIEMPEMDGVQALDALMTRTPVPVVMVSSLTTRGTELTLRCLELGAVDFILKPSGNPADDLFSIRYILWQKLRHAAAATLPRTLPIPAVSMPSASPVVSPVRPHRSARRLIAIAASTGGPRALGEILHALPGPLPAAMVIVQHMPAQFTATMAHRFDQQCPFPVREAAEGTRLEEGVVLIAPGGLHVRLTTAGLVTLAETPPLWGVRPAADYLFLDVASGYGPQALGIVLTGMGRDGADGLSRMRAAGALTLAQDAASCVVYGMPRAAVEAGGVARVVPLARMAEAILAWCGPAA